MNGQVTAPEQAFSESGAESDHLESIPLAQLSIEVGHLYFEDFAAGADSLARHFERVAPWVRAIEAMPATGRPRISTCFLVDDYFGPSSSPAAVLPDLLQAAKDAGLRIDYLARESACAEADGVPLARLVESLLVADPPPNTTGTRPPVTESGWLCNGQRSPAHAAEALEPAMVWTPPAENATTRHSVFVDVELWDERPGRGRVWSCAFLASIWQLMRLGLLRHHGRAVAVPKPWDGHFPDVWQQLPGVMKVNPEAVPFTAYRTVSILGSRFLPTELAVRTILSQVAVDPRVLGDVVRRARAEGIDLPAEPVDWLRYVFAT